MNAKIKAYWEKFHGAEAILNEMTWYYLIPTKEERTDSFAGFVIAILFNGEWLYPFNGEFHTESVMLRLLNLRAFL